jgi:uncharacterized protein (TIGR03067 family)
MRAILLLLIALVPPDRPSSTPKDEPKKTLHDEILGSWHLDKMTVGGAGIGNQPVPDKTNLSLQFTRTEILPFENGKQKPNDSASYTLDLARKPVAIDFKPRNDQKAMQGILKLEGDRLFLCIAAMGGRPTEFSTNGKEITVLMEFKRINK